MKIRYMAAIPVLLAFLLSNVFATDGRTSKVWKDYVKNGPVVGNLPDFHTAGCAPERFGAEKGKTYNVTDYGANPKDRENDRDAIQRAIDTAGAAGGGIVYFPEGRYYIPGGNESNIIQVRHSNIILRGPGLDSKGRQQAILFLQRVSQGKKGGLVGRDEPDHRENGCIMIKGENSGKMVATLASDGKRGDTVITVDSTKALSQGQIISIKAEDSIDLENPRLEDIDLIAELNEPRALTEKDDKTWNNIHTKIIYSIYRVKRIISATELELSRPLRFNHKLSYKARIESFPGALTGVGVEDLGIETDWPGQFVHHKPYPYWYGKKAEGVVRPAKEQDYEWVGIWASWAVDCWIKDVSIRDTTQGLVMANAHHFTVENVSLYGAEGHAGITMTMSGDSLFRDLYFVQRSCHPISLRSWCSGNVFTKCTAHFSKRDHLSATGPHVDFHGMFPYENLFECLVGFYPVSGGSRDVHPNAGVRNVFWNILTPPMLDRHIQDGNDEFLNCNYSEYKEQYKEYPQAFVIGCYSPADHPTVLKIAGSSEDKATPEYTAELLNKRLTNLKSLYAAQVELHKEVHGRRKFPRANRLN